MILHNVIIHIKSVLNKDKNHYYYEIFLEKCSYQLAKETTTNFVHSIIMMKFEEREIAKDIFYAAKRPIRIWGVNVDNIVISKLVKTKKKYLIGNLDKGIRPLVLIMP